MIRTKSDTGNRSTKYGRRCSSARRAHSRRPAGGTPRRRSAPGGGQAHGVGPGSWHCSYRLWMTRPARWHQPMRLMRHVGSAEVGRHGQRRPAPGGRRRRLNGPIHLVRRGKRHDESLRTTWRRRGAHVRAGGRHSGLQQGQCLGQGHNAPRIALHLKRVQRFDAQAPANSRKTTPNSAVNNTMNITTIIIAYPRRRGRAVLIGVHQKVQVRCGGLLIGLLIG